LTAVDVSDEMRDFTINRRTIKFKIDDDVFEAVKDIPAQIMLDFAVGAQQLETTASNQGVETILKLLEMSLLPESGQRFRRRMSDPDSPIGIQTVMEVIPWLMEQYGMRPTQSPEPSSTGSPDPGSGTRSTASVPEVASTSSVLTPVPS